MTVTPAASTPLYQHIKNYVLKHIVSGEWQACERVPSESELMRCFDASRMTVNRALRELAREGYLLRRQGLGTFVAEPKPQSDLLEIRNIAEEIDARGHCHESQVFELSLEEASGETALELDVALGTPVFHSIIAHWENGIPIQLEDRFVNPVVAPYYLNKDFTRITPNEYLTAVAPLQEAEHIVQATMPDRRIRRWLQMPENEPCLLVFRRTWTSGVVGAVARLFHPGSRYRLSGRFRPAPSGTATVQPSRPRFSTK